MRRFLSNLVRSFRTTKTARPARRAPRRANLYLEGLEDRLVMSTVSTVALAGRALQVNAAPAHQIRFQADQHDATKLDVLDNGKLVRQVPIASVDLVLMKVAGQDAVDVDYSNGLPFAPGTQMLLSGSGSQNSLTLEGSRTVKGGETYISMRNTSIGQAASLAVGAGGNLEDNDGFYLFTGAIGSVTDLVKTTAPLVAESLFGSNVTLSGSNGVTQTLSGLSNGGAGDTLTYSNKGLVQLEMLSDNAKATLSATAAAAGEHSLVVDLSGGHDNLHINATPRTVDTSVVVAPGTAANPSFVNLAANAGRVSIAGNGTALVSVGRGVTYTTATTAGIEADVSVSNVALLAVTNSANRTTKENVTVTESTISGTGLFGNNAAKLSYSGTQFLQIATGQLADTYKVIGSKPGATFTSSIDIASTSYVGLSVAVTLDARSGLHLDVSNYVGCPSASLFVSALGGTVHPPSPIIPPGYFATGHETVTFPHGLTSEISYQDMTSVTNFTGVPHF
jgi:hypothetical protein